MAIVTASFRSMPLLLRSRPRNLSKIRIMSSVGDGWRCRRKTISSLLGIKSADEGRCSLCPDKEMSIGAGYGVSNG